LRKKAGCAACLHAEEKKALQAQTAGKEEEGDSSPEQMLCYSIISLNLPTWQLSQICCSALLPMCGCCNN